MVLRDDAIHSGSSSDANVTSLSFVTFERPINPVNLVSMTKG